MRTLEEAPALPTSRQSYAPDEPVRPSIPPSFPIDGRKRGVVIREVGYLAKLVGKEPPQASLPVYDAEIAAGLAEKVRASASVSLTAAAEPNPWPVATSQAAIMASIPASNDNERYRFYTVPRSTGQTGVRGCRFNPEHISRFCARLFGCGRPQCR
jgi:hypothetical protein